MISARIALLITVLLYPWDSFAISLGVWTYPNDTGLRIYGVPLNDSIFIWLCSYLACVVLIRIDSRNSKNGSDPQG
jgi:lycopene cyclase domain-containing protein